VLRAADELPATASFFRLFVAPNLRGATRAVVVDASVFAQIVRTRIGKKHENFALPTLHGAFVAALGSALGDSGGVRDRVAFERVLALGPHESLLIDRHRIVTIRPVSRIRRRRGDVVGSVAWRDAVRRRAALSWRECERRGQEAEIMLRESDIALTSSSSYTIYIDVNATHGLAASIAATADVFGDADVDDGSRAFHLPVRRVVRVSDEDLRRVLGRSGGFTYRQRKAKMCSMLFERVLSEMYVTSTRVFVTCRRSLLTPDACQPADGVCRCLVRSRSPRWLCRRASGTRWWQWPAVVGRGRALRAARRHWHRERVPNVEGHVLLPGSRADSRRGASADADGRRGLLVSVPSRRASCRRRGRGRGRGRGCRRGLEHGCREP
jgi:hypothetical protein